jgi:hypothetical protein
MNGAPAAQRAVINTTAENSRPGIYRCRRLCAALNVANTCYQLGKKCFHLYRWTQTGQTIGPSGALVSPPFGGQAMCDTDFAPPSRSHRMLHPRAGIGDGTPIIMSAQKC